MANKSLLHLNSSFSGTGHRYTIGVCGVSDVHSVHILFLQHGSGSANRRRLGGRPVNVRIRSIEFARAQLQANTLELGSKMPIPNILQFALSLSSSASRRSSF